MLQDRMKHEFVAATSPGADAGHDRSKRLLRFRIALDDRLHRAGDTALSPRRNRAISTPPPDTARTAPTDTEVPTPIFVDARSMVNARRRSGRRRVRAMPRPSPR